MLLITEIESLSKTVVISSAAAHHTIDGSASITWDNEGRIRFRQYLRSQGEVQSLLTERKEVKTKLGNAGILANQLRLAKPKMKK